MSAPAARVNLLLIGVDSLRADHLSGYGYPRLTSPHLDNLASEGVLVEDHVSPAIPTTPGYASMLSGRDCFGTGVVGLRHRGPLAPGTVTLAEVLGERGYQTTCVGFTGNPASRGFSSYLDYDSWGAGAEGFSPKAERLAEVALPELDRMSRSSEPFFLFLRHMDPHTPYLPPPPFARLFYGGDEADPGNTSMEPVYDFAPFAEYFRSWIPEGVTDRHFVDALYDGAVAYLDASIGELLSKLKALGRDEDTLVVLTSDHGETLYEHDCFYDHHGLYEPTLRVPLVLRLPGSLPAGRRVVGHSHAKDVTPTVLDLLGVERPGHMEVEGHSLVPLWAGGERPAEPEWYLTEATWMRKHGWRSVEWKLIVALEPDFHSKPAVELYHLSEDPEELVNRAETEPEVVAYLQARMNAHVARRVEQTGRQAPILEAVDWHGLGTGPFQSSAEAYQQLHIGSRARARSLQAGEASTDGNGNKAADAQAQPEPEQKADAAEQSGNPGS